MVLGTVLYKMKRKEIITDVNEYKEFDTDYSCGDSPIEISEMIELLTDAKESGATHIKVTGGGYDGQVDYIYVQPVKVEIESDADYNKRVAEAESKRLAIENMEKAREKALYYELKAKYGD